MNKREQELITTIRESTRTIVKQLGYLTNIFASIGSLSQCYTLHALERGNLTLLELSDELTLDRSTVSRLAKELVQKGYCHYLVNKNDGRSRYLELTALGKQKLAFIHYAAIERVAEALCAVTDEEQELIAKGLSLYASALKTTHHQGE